MKATPIEWGAATRILRGEMESGDRHLVRELPGGALIAAVDGIGHGREAAIASQLAIETLEDHAGEAPVALLERCHERLRGTRGVVMGLARFDAGERSLAWVGVGNVDGLVLRASPVAGERRERLLQRPGVVGGRLPALHPNLIPVRPGDLLIFVTDGVAGLFDEGLDPRASPQTLAESILAAHDTGTDDATVLVARLGRRP